MVKPDEIIRYASLAIGKKYVFGAEVKPDIPIELVQAFDCSELVEYVCRHFKLKMPDGSGNQYNFCSKYGTLITTDEAMKTPAALLFMRNPQSHAICHVAFSIGDGRTIEARGAKFGTNVFKKRGGWSDAAKIPGVTYELV